MPDVRENRGKLAVYMGILAVAILVIVVSLVRSCGSNAQSATKPAPPSPASPVAKAQPGRFDEAAFWQLTTSARHGAGDNNTGEESHLLEERLSKMPPQSIIAYERLLKQMDHQLYTWDVWGAADVIEDGCSADCFRDFRRYVIFLGPDAYKKATTNPDELAPLVQDAENGDWENADDVAGDAYSSRTGNDFPLDDSDLSGRPRGTQFNDNDIAALVKRYPKLAAKFRGY